MESYTKEIKKDYPNAKIEICDSEFNIQLFDTTLKISYDSDLQQFKKKLRKMAGSTKNTECEICFESFKYSYSIYCSECYNNVCMICYNKIKIKGKGIFTCPYCRHKEGKTFQTNMDLLINLCARNISVFAEVYIPDYILPAIGIYITYLEHEKKYIFESGGIFKEIDGMRSDECEINPDNSIKFYNEILPFFKGNIVFEKVTEN